MPHQKQPRSLKPHRRITLSKVTFCIRRARERDLKAIQKVFANAYHQRYAAAGEFYSNCQLVDPNYATSSGPYYTTATFVRANITGIKRRLKSPFSCWVALNGSTIIGYIITERHLGKLWINDLLVSSEWQRHGVGKLLFERVTRGHPEVYLWVNAANAAVHFWQRLGFRPLLREVLMKLSASAKR